MKKILLAATIGIFGILGNNAFADSAYKNTAEYKQLDSQMRTHLQECLNNQQMTTKECIKNTKETFKSQKKMLKKQYKDKMNG